MGDASRRSNGSGQRFPLGGCVEVSSLWSYTPLSPSDRLAIDALLWFVCEVANFVIKPEKVEPHLGEAICFGRMLFPMLPGVHVGVENKVWYFNKILLYLVL